jgi:hypothetical protein
MKMTLTCACDHRFGAWRERCPECAATAPQEPKTPKKRVMKCSECGAHEKKRVEKKPKTPADKRSDYELDVLRSTVFHTETMADTKRAAIKYAYDRVLADRALNVSTTMR